MIILSQQWSQKKDHNSKDQDQPSQLKMHLSCAGITILILSATIIGIKILIIITNCASRKARSNVKITITPSAPYDPQMFDIPITPLPRSPSRSSNITQEAARLNQLMVSNIRERTNHINAAVNLNQLMGFDNTDLTQSLAEEFLMTAMETEDPHYNRVTIC